KSEGHADGVAFQKRRERCDRLNPAGPREFPRLETFAAEDRSALRRTERYGGLFAAGRAVRGGLHALATNHAAARGARGALGLAALAALRLVLEILVGEEQLFAGGPDERGPTVHAVQGLVLEL